MSSEQNKKNYSRIQGGAFVVDGYAYLILGMGTIDILETLSMHKDIQGIIGTGNALRVSKDFKKVKSVLSEEETRKRYETDQTKNPLKFLESGKLAPLIILNRTVKDKKEFNRIRNKKHNQIVFETSNAFFTKPQKYSGSRKARLRSKFVKTTRTIHCANHSSMFEKEKQFSSSKEIRQLLNNFKGYFLLGYILWSQKFADSQGLKSNYLMNMQDNPSEILGIALVKLAKEFSYQNQKNTSNLFLPNIDSYSEQLETSKRLQDMETSEHFAKHLEKARAKNKKVYDVSTWLGSNLKVPQDFFKILKQISGPLCFPQPKGLPETRNAWHKYFQRFNIDYSPDEIVITAGSSEALLFSMAATCNPGDQIILFDPTYIHYKTLASFLNINLVPIKTIIENNYAFPETNEIEQKITKKTKAVIVCNAYMNRTYTKQELQKIAKISKKHNLFIISDEIYREFVYQTDKFYSMYKFPEIAQNLILIESISKKMGACGIRLGCLATKNQKMLETMKRYRYMLIGAPVVEQIAVSQILKNSKKYTDLLKKEYKHKLAIMYEELKNIPGIICDEKPVAGIQIHVKIPWMKDSDKFVKWALTDFSHNGKTVLFGPQSRFYTTPNTGKDEIYIYPVYSEKQTVEIIQILKKALEKYKALQYQQTF